MVIFNQNYSQIVPKLPTGWVVDTPHLCRCGSTGPVVLSGSAHHLAAARQVAVEAVTWANIGTSQQMAKLNRRLPTCGINGQLLAIINMRDFLPEVSPPVSWAGSVTGIPVRLQVESNPGCWR